MSTFVLVHGAYHGGWCYSKVVASLEAAGHKAIAVDLPGHGDNPLPRDQVTLDRYVGHVCDIVDAQSEPVVQVGHSMGGLTISQVAEERPDKLKMIVFLTALMPKDGENRGDLAARLNEEQAAVAARIPTEDGLANTIAEDRLVDLFYADCSEADVALARQKLIPQPVAPMQQKVRLSDDGYGRVPRVYIECLQDNAIALRMQRAMYESVPVDRVITMDTSHSPFFSAPDELSTHLASLAG